MSFLLFNRKKRRRKRKKGQKWKTCGEWPKFSENDWLVVSDSDVRRISRDSSSS